MTTKHPGIQAIQDEMRMKQAAQERIKAGERFIVKIQLPIEGSPGMPKAVLIYNKDRSVEWVADDPNDVWAIKKAVKNEAKAFMWATLSDEKFIVLEDLAPWQDW